MASINAKLKTQCYEILSQHSVLFILYISFQFFAHVIFITATMRVDSKDLPGVTERTTTGFSLPATKPKPSTGSRLISTRRGAGGTPSRWTSSRELLWDTWLENTGEEDHGDQEKFTSLSGRRKKGTGTSYNSLWLWFTHSSDNLLALYPNPDWPKMSQANSFTSRTHVGSMGSKVLVQRLAMLRDYCSVQYNIDIFRQSMLTVTLLQLWESPESVLTYSNYRAK